MTLLPFTVISFFTEAPALRGPKAHAASTLLYDIDTVLYSFMKSCLQLRLTAQYYSISNTQNREQFKLLPNIYNTNKYTKMYPRTG